MKRNIILTASDNKYGDFLINHWLKSLLDNVNRADISRLFNEDKQSFRAVPEDNKSLFSFFMNEDFFSRDDKADLLNRFLNNKMVNAGLLLGPRSKMKYICRECIKRIKNKEKFGPDQILINSILYKEGFKELSKAFNFVISSSNNRFLIKNGVFYFKSGEIIPVVHNAGGLKILRPIDNFGYGEGFNTIKYPLYATLKIVNRSSNNLYDFYRSIINQKNTLMKLHQSVVNKYPGRKNRLAI